MFITNQMKPKTSNSVRGPSVSLARKELSEASQSWDLPRRCSFCTGDLPLRWPAPPLSVPVRKK